MSRDLASALTPAGRSRPFRRGRVTAVGSKVATVELDGELVELPVLATVAYAVGDVVLVAADGSSSGIVLGKIGTTAPPAAPATPTSTSPTVPRQRTAVIVPTFTGTYRGSSWRTDTRSLYQGDWTGSGINQGAAYYGTALKSLGVKTDRPYSVVVSYRRGRGGVFAAQSPTFYTLSGTSRPAGAPGRLLSATGDAVSIGELEAYQLPANMAAQLVTAAAGGVGIYVAGASPYVQLEGRDASSDSMALTVTYYA